MKGDEGIKIGGGRFLGKNVTQTLKSFKYIPTPKTPQTKFGGGFCGNYVL